VSNKRFRLWISMARNNITAVRSRIPLRSIGFKLPQYSKRVHPIMKSPAILNTNRKSCPLPRKKLGWIGISTSPRLIRNHSMAIKPSTTAPTRKAVFNMTTILFEIFSLLLAPYFFLPHNVTNHRRQINLSDEGAEATRHSVILSVLASGN
jgi:hypothetical protein